MVNMHLLGTAMEVYLADYDDRYAQTKKSSFHPEIEDLAGGLESSGSEQVFDLLKPYYESLTVLKCPADAELSAKACATLQPHLTSYVVNGAFVFGLTKKQVENPLQTIMMAERRSGAVVGAPAYCDSIYHPWWNGENSVAPQDDMDETKGAVATTRHSVKSNYLMADCSVKAHSWSETYSLPNVNMHVIHQP